MPPEAKQAWFQRGNDHSNKMTYRWQYEPSTPCQSNARSSLQNNDSKNPEEEPENPYQIWRSTNGNKPGELNHKQNFQKTIKCSPMKLKNEKEKVFTIINTMTILGGPALFVCITTPKFFCGHISIRDTCKLQDRKVEQQIANFGIERGLLDHPHWKWLKFFNQEKELHIPRKNNPFMNSMGYMPRDWSLLFNISKSTLE